MSVSDASRAEDQDSLLVLLGDTIDSGRLRRRRLGKRFVNGGHCDSALLCVSNGLGSVCTKCANCKSGQKFVGVDRAEKNAKTRKSWQQEKIEIWINIILILYSLYCCILILDK